MVAKSDLICDLLIIIGEARRPKYPSWRFKIDDAELDLKFQPKRALFQGRIRGQVI